MLPSWLSTPSLRLRAALITLMFTLVFGILLAAWAALLPFFLGLIAAYIAMPIVDLLDNHAPKFLRRKRWSRPLAIAIVYIVTIGLVTGFLAYFVPLFTEQATALGKMLPSLWEQIQTLVTYDFDTLLESIQPQIREAIDANLAKAGETIVSGLQRGIQVTFTALSQTVSFVLGMLIVPIWLFYVLNDRAKASRTFYAWVPDAIEQDVRHIVRIVDDLLSAYVRGQILLCVIVGVLATTTLLLFDIPSALLLGTIAGILEVIPYLGPYLGALAPVALALVDRPILALWVALSFAAIQQIENMFLVPRISGSAVRFHPGVVMVIVIVGAEIAGLWGLLLGVPLAAMLRDVYQYLYLRTTERGATPEMAMESLRARAS